MNVVINFHSCDVIWEPMTRGGIKRTVSDQTSRILCGAVQGLVFLSHMGICRKHFSRFLHNLVNIYEYMYMKKGRSRKTLICSAINWVFPDEVTYLD